jgi:hypothetical protein
MAVFLSEGSPMPFIPGESIRTPAFLSERYQIHVKNTFIDDFGAGADEEGPMKKVQRSCSEPVLPSFAARADEADAKQEVLERQPEDNSEFVSVLDKMESKRTVKGAGGAFQHAASLSPDMVLGAPMVGLPMTASFTGMVNEERASFLPQKEARRMTLVLNYFPRKASAEDICSALDVALDKTHTVRRCRIVRDREGNGLYGFFEFQDHGTMESAVAACSYGSVTMKDEWNHTWYIHASRSNRATVAESEPPGSLRRRRGKRGGDTCGRRLAA